MRFFFITSFFLIYHVLCSSFLFPAELKPSIAILDLGLINVRQDAGRIIRNKIEFSFYNSGRFNILERNRLDLLKNENKLTGKIINSTEYALEAGRILPAEFVLAGSITFTGRYFIHLNLVDVKNGIIIYSFDREYESEDLIYIESENIRKDIENKIFLNSPVEKYTEKFNEENRFYLSVNTGYIPPLSKADFSNGGLIVNAEFGIKDLLTKNITAGFSAGYNHFYTNAPVNYTSITPLIITSSYIFEFSIFNISPGLGFGPAYILINKENSRLNAFEPCGLLFIKSDFFIKSNVALELSVSYYSIFERDGVIDFFSFTGGVVSYF